MSVGLVLLAVLMGSVTYPSRAIPLLAPGIDRLPHWALLYLGLVGPAVLATLAAVNVTVVPAGTGQTFHVGVEWLAVAASVGLVAWRKNLFVGLTVGVVLVAAARALGWAA